MTSLLNSALSKQLRKSFGKPKLIKLDLLERKLTLWEWCKEKYFVKVFCKDACKSNVRTHKRFEKTHIESTHPFIKKYLFIRKHFIKNKKTPITIINLL